MVVREVIKGRAMASYISRADRSLSHVSNFTSVGASAT